MSSAPGPPPGPYPAGPPSPPPGGGRFRRARPDRVVGTGCRGALLGMFFESVVGGCLESIFGGCFGLIVLAALLTAAIKLIASVH